MIIVINYREVEEILLDNRVDNNLKLEMNLVYKHYIMNLKKKYMKIYLNIKNNLMIFSK